jgi:hypothetical protein
MVRQSTPPYTALTTQNASFFFKERGLNYGRVMFNTQLPWLIFILTKSYQLYDQQ